MAEEERIPMQDMGEPPPDESPDIDYDESHVSGTRETDFTYDNYDDPNRDYDKEFDHSRNENVNTRPPPSLASLQKRELTNNKKRMVEELFGEEVVKRASRDVAKLLDNVSFEYGDGRIKYVNFRNKRVGEIEYSFFGKPKINYVTEGDKGKEFRFVVKKAIQDTKKYRARKFVQESHEMDLFEDTSEKVKQDALQEEFPPQEETSFISHTLDTTEHKYIIDKTLTDMIQLSDKRKRNILVDINALDKLEGGDKLKKVISNYCSESIETFMEDEPVKYRVKAIKKNRDLLRRLKRTRDPDILSVFGRFDIILERDQDILRFKKGYAPETNDNVNMLDNNIESSTVKKYKDILLFLKRNGVGVGAIVATVGGTIVTSIIFLKMDTHKLGSRLVHTSKQLDKLRKEMVKERQEQSKKQALLEQIQLELKKRQAADPYQKARLRKKEQAKPILGPSQKEARRQDALKPQRDIVQAKPILGPSQKEALRQEALRNAQNVKGLALLVSSNVFDILGKVLFLFEDNLTISLIVLSIVLTVSYAKIK